MTPKMDEQLWNPSRRLFDSKRVRFRLNFSIYKGKEAGTNLWQSKIENSAEARRCARHAVAKAPVSASLTHPYLGDIRGAEPSVDSCGFLRLSTGKKLGVKRSTFSAQRRQREVDEGDRVDAQLEPFQEHNFHGRHHPG